jgi:hypothetical protein
MSIRPRPAAGITSAGAWAQSIRNISWQADVSLHYSPQDLPLDGAVSADSSALRAALGLATAKNSADSDGGPANSPEVTSRETYDGPVLSRKSNQQEPRGRGLGSREGESPSGDIERARLIRVSGHVDQASTAAVKMP